MRPEDWQRIEELFEQAIALPPEDRPGLFSGLSEEDQEIRLEVESLLAAEDEAGRFLEEPILPGPIHRRPGAEDAVGPDGRIGAYRLLRKLGEGGMSRVYLAVRDDDEFQKLVALKVIRRGMDSSELLRRFRTERQILASLDHPNIAGLLDGGSTENGLPYFIMEYIQGLPIDEYCDRRRLPLRKRLRLFRQVCAAVQYAHQNLVVHRDIKPNNILVTSDGVPRLLDFGIAKLLKPEHFPVPVELTATALRPMSPYYASPEQVAGRAVTTGSDIYSLGVLLFKLLTGQLPYRLRNWTAAEVETAVLGQDVERPSATLDRGTTQRLPGQEDVVVSPKAVAKARGAQVHQLRRQLAGDLDNIVLATLRKEPQRRYSSVEQLSDDIRRYLEGQPVLAHKDSFRYRAGKFLRRNLVPVTVAAAFLALLIGFAVSMTMQAHRVTAERDRAQLERDRAEQVVSFLQEIFQVSDPRQGGGETVTAREILDRGARRVSQELGAQPEIQATLMEAIGNVYGNLGLFDWSETLLRQALEKRKEVLGDEHPAVAQSLSNLGLLLQARGDYASAEPLLERALTLRRNAFGEEHPLVGESLHNLGRLRHNMGDFAGAEDLYRRGVRVQRDSVGHLSPELASLLSNLAMLLTEMARFEDAEPLFHEALEVRRTSLGPEHPLTAEGVNNLAVFLAMRGDLDAAEPLFLEALDLRRKIYGPAHPDAAEALNNLGRLRKEKGDFEEAERLYREAIQVITDAAGPEHPQVAIFQNNLAVMLMELGELEKAEPLFRSALEVRRKHLLEELHPLLGVSQRGLGTLLVRKGDLQAGESLLHEALETFESSLPEDHWRVGEGKAYLGECLAAQGRYEDAETLMLEGYEILESSRGPEHRRTLQVIDLVVALYDSWEKPDQAARFRALKTS